jgi:hypothetical protein
LYRQHQEPSETDHGDTIQELPKSNLIALYLWNRAYDSIANDKDDKDTRTLVETYEKTLLDFRFGSDPSKRNNDDEWKINSKTNSIQDLLALAQIHGTPVLIASLSHSFDGRLAILRTPSVSHSSTSSSKAITTITLERSRHSGRDNPWPSYYILLISK